MFSFLDGNLKRRSDSRSILVPAELRHDAIPGKRFFARVNIGALREEDLFFTDFQPAPDPDSDDGLA